MLGKQHYPDEPRPWLSVLWMKPWGADLTPPSEVYHTHSSVAAWTYSSGLQLEELLSVTPYASGIHLPLGLLSDHRVWHLQSTNSLGTSRVSGVVILSGGGHKNTRKEEPPPLPVPWSPREEERSCQNRSSLTCPLARGLEPLPLSKCEES